MSMIGNQPGVSSQRTVLEEVVTGSAKSNFVPQGGYVIGYVDVLVNGSELDSSDFTAADGININLAVAAAVGDTVKVKAWLPRGLSDGYLKSEADARFLKLIGGTLSGDITVSKAADNARVWLESVGGSGRKHALISDTNGAFQVFDNTAAASRIIVDSSGRVQMPFQPAFHIRGGGYATSYSSGNRNAGAGDSPMVVANNGSYYSTGTGRFTAPVAGTYEFYVGATPANPSGNIGMRIQKNGVTELEYGLCYYTSYQGNQVSCIATLAANDYVEGLLIWNNSQASAIYASFFGGHLIG